MQELIERFKKELKKRHDISNVSDARLEKIGQIASIIDCCNLHRNCALGGEKKKTISSRSLTVAGVIKEAMKNLADKQNYMPSVDQLIEASFTVAIAKLHQVLKEKANLKGGHHARGSKRDHKLGQRGSVRTYV